MTTPPAPIEPYKPFENYGGIKNIYLSLKAGSRGERREVFPDHEGQAALVVYREEVGNQQRS